MSAVVGLSVLALWFVRPVEGGMSQAVLLGVTLLAIGTIAFEIGSVAYNALLLQISGPRTIGRISGIGWGAGFIESVELFIREEAFHRECGIYGRTAMPFGGDELVSVGLGRVFGIVTHLTSVQDGEYIGNAQRAAKMAGADGMDRLESAETDLNGKRFYLFSFINIHSFCFSFPINYFVSA